MTKTEIDPAVLEAFLRANPEAVKEMEAITAHRHQISERALQIVAELDGSEELEAEVVRLKEGGEVGAVHVPTAAKPARQPRQPKVAKQPKAAGSGPGRPSVAALEALSTEERREKIAFARASNKPWLLGKLLAIEKAHGKAPTPAPAPTLRALNKQPATVKVKGTGWQGKAGGQPKNLTEATTRLKAAKAAGHVTLAEKLSNWIEEHRRTGVSRGENARKTAGGFGRAFSGRSGGAAHTAPQQSAQG